MFYANISIFFNKILKNNSCFIQIRYQFCRFRHHAVHQWLHLSHCCIQDGTGLDVHLARIQLKPFKPSTTKKRE
jgi:hypothetical protein